VFPVCPEAIVAAVTSTLAGPFFSRMVTGPLASDQVMFKPVPALMPTNDCGGMVNLAALASAKAAAATTAKENCIVKELVEDCY